jgi:hypothetical protein
LVGRDRIELSTQGFSVLPDFVWTEEKTMKLGGSFRDHSRGFQPEVPLKLPLGFSAFMSGDDGDDSRPDFQMS